MKHITEIGLLARYIVETSKPKSFKPWVLDIETCSLELPEFGYYIPLADIHNSAEMLDWIFQLQSKTFTNAEIMYQLLRALDFYLHPQANFCSWGKNLRVDRPQDLVGRWAKI